MGFISRHGSPSGRKTKFVKCDEERMDLSYTTKIKKAITKKTKWLILIHLQIQLTQVIRKKKY